MDRVHFHAHGDGEQAQAWRRHGSAAEVELEDAQVVVAETLEGLQPPAGVLVLVWQDGRTVQSACEGLEFAERVIGCRLTLEGPGLVELCAATVTSRATEVAATAMARRLGAAVVHLPDRGFSAEARLRALRPTSAAEVTDAFLEVCGRLLDENVVSARDLARITKQGWGWAHGPLRLMKKQPESFHLRRQWRSRQSFDAPPVRVEVDGDRATLTLCRPHALNALDPEFLEAFDEAFGGIEAEPDVRSVVFASEAAAFLAGVDARWILDCMEDDDFDSIDRFVQRGQALFTRIDESPLQTVVRLEGMAAGAGAELLCCVDHVLATRRASIVFPETSIGIHPALGGTQRLKRIVGLPFARWMILAGEPVRAEEAVELGLVDRIVPRTKMDEALRTWTGERPKRIPTSRRLLEAQAQFRSGTTPELTGRAPLALRSADQLMRLDLPLSEGLAREREALRPIFESEDALRGIRARAEGRRFVQFRGN